MTSRTERGLLRGSTLAVLALVSAACGPSGGTLHEPAEARIRHATRAVPGRYIVVLREPVQAEALHQREGPRRVEATVEGFRRRYAFDTDHMYVHALRGFAARMSPATAATLSADPDVAYVEEDAEIHLDDSQSGAGWGLDRLDARAFGLDRVFDYDSRGDGVHAFVIDSGIDATHADFDGRVQPGLTWVSDGLGTSDCNGHGTHVAGTIGGATYGVAKKVLLHPMRTMDCSGQGLVSASISALDWIVGSGQRPAVVNMSLGGGVSSAQDSAVARTVAAGITVVIAAGNESVDACSRSPSREPGAVTVGASDHTASADVIAGYSNWGPCVDLFAPGTSIQSDAPGGGTRFLSGTSMAAPHVTGAVAQYLERNPRATAAWIGEDLIANATAGVVTGALRGAPNRLLFTPSVPFARAGADRIVGRGAAVVLDGSASSSSRGGITNHSWRQTAGPAVALTGASAATATFTAPSVTASTKLSFRLRVTDAAGTFASSGVNVTVVPAALPVANAGPAQTVLEGSTVTLDGSLSSGDVTSYAWAQTAGPGVALTGASTARPTFVAPAVASSTPLMFRLTVSSAAGENGSSTVTVTVLHVNRPPSASAGPPQSTSPEVTVTLDGSGSADPDGSLTSYSWSQVDGPPAALAGASTARPSFVAPRVAATTALTFRLTVTDDAGASASSSVTITVVYEDRPPVERPVPEAASTSAAAPAPAVVRASSGGCSSSAGSGLGLCWLVLLPSLWRSVTGRPPASTAPAGGQRLPRQLRLAAEVKLAPDLVGLGERRRSRGWVALLASFLNDRLDHRLDGALRLGRRHAATSPGSRVPDP
jgi:subtilisin family serine protease